MTHPVGMRLPNPWGLYDMGGNVGAWCRDWHDNLPGGTVIDPQGPVSGVYNQSGTGSDPFHVSRVSGWDGMNTAHRSAFRGFYDNGSGDSSLGIRLVLALRE